MSRALVLGGGGVTGVAWELGVLEGLRSSGVDLTNADVVIGTSAGSVVGTRITTGSLPAAYDDQLRPSSGEIASSLPLRTQLRLGWLLARRGDRATKWRAVGAAAARAHPTGSVDRTAVIRSRIGDPDWPDRDLRVTAVDVDAGEFVVFDRDSGVSLLDAVTASCAVPLVWPPVRIGSTVHVDGGVRSAANADLAEGAERVVVLAPMTAAASREQTIERQLGRTGALLTTTVTPDAAARADMGRNSLDPGHRAAAARSGRRQGREIAANIARVWG